MPITLDYYKQEIKQNPNFKKAFEKYLSDVQITEKDISKALKKYAEFCKYHGFKKTLNKTWREFYKETRIISIYDAEQCLTSSYKEKNLKSFLNDLSVLPEDSLNEIYKQHKRTNIIGIIADDYKNMLQEDKEIYVNMLLMLYKSTKLLKNNLYIGILSHVVYYNYYWINDYKLWTPKSHNQEKQFFELIRYLFCKYPIPVFIERIWIHSNTRKKYLNLFFHMSNGFSVRTYKDLVSKPISKKTAHYFTLAPDNSDILSALTWGYIKSLGGNERLINPLRETWVFRHGYNPGPFLESIINFFLKYPFLDTSHYNPILDYIWNIKYVESNIQQPNFSMKGRIPEALLNQVERWHRQLNKEKKGKIDKWEPVQIKNYLAIYGTYEKGNRREIIIKQLTTKRELCDEGRAMSNCVASYANSCSKGRISIWSLYREDHMGKKHLATIELDGNRIVQAKAKINQKISNAEWQHIFRWKNKENLLISSYL